MPNRPRASNLKPPRSPLAKRPRLKTAERGYAGAWPEYRLWFLRLHPLCTHCEEKGVFTPANEVDHIHGHKGQDDPMFWNPENLSALCHVCHSRKTGRERNQTRGL